MTEIRATDPSSWKTGPITPPLLHHATFMTLDVNAMVEFYELVCGMHPVYYGHDAAWLTNDLANHRIALLKLPGTVPPINKPHSAGLHHTAFEYATFDQWLDNYERLAAIGLEPHICFDHGMTMSMYYADPDGNGVEIQVDNFRDWGMSKEWMWASQEFAADYIGAPFDPAKLVEARRAGLSPDEIHERTYARQYVPEGYVPVLTFPDPWPDRIAADPTLLDGVPAPDAAPEHVLEPQG
ncbi:VOC family protein [Leifsonia sp. EB34]|uniref:VOC family protein n=1 Tax=Leifsonia sp. EB34 TaxID=3156303 RepID=UPI0035190950